METKIELKESYLINSRGTYIIANPDILRSTVIRKWFHDNPSLPFETRYRQEHFNDFLDFLYGYGDPTKIVKQMYTEFQTDEESYKFDNNNYRVSRAITYLRDNPTKMCPGDLYGIKDLSGNKSFTIDLESEQLQLTEEDLLTISKILVSNEPLKHMILHTSHDYCKHIIRHFYEDFIDRDVVPSISATGQTLKYEMSRAHSALAER